MKPRKTLAERFWPKVNKSGNVPPHRRRLGRCWLWTAATLSNGYGVLGLPGRRTAYAHRVSWLLATGSWPNPCALHKCDNPRCVRPSHLFEGTIADNNADGRRKGRMAPPPLHVGERQWQARLTASMVVSIRERVAKGETRKSIAASLGVAARSVELAARRASWKHVP